MQVHKIRIKNFKSIYDEIELDFEQISGFWKISGSVGSGKTTIGEAIIFALYGGIKGKNNGDLVAWGQKSGYVELWCTSNGHKLYIKRDFRVQGQSPIVVEVDGEPLIFTNKNDAQKQLEQEYYDISRITLELLCIISFNNFKSLSQLNTSETKKFLDEVFGFYVLTNYSALCKEQSQSASSILTDFKSEYGAIQNKLLYIEKINNIERVSGDIEALMGEYTPREKDLQVRGCEHDKKRKELQAKLLEQTKQSSNIKAIGKKLASEISLIKSGTCPTCGSPIDDSVLPEKEKERETLLKSYNDSETQAKSIEKEIADCDAEYKKIETKLRAEMNSLNTQIIKLREQAKRDTINSGEVGILQEQLQDKQDQITQQEVEIQEWSELNSILTNEVRSKILSSFIPRINNSIQKYSQQLGQPYIIEFDSSFKCNIHLLNIDNNIPISSLSTGQLKTVDMCIILGILDVIMSNINFNICFLDELFSNMDGDLRQLMCHVLKNNLKEDQILFIISHVELDDKYFDGEIHAELEYIKDSILKKSKYTIRKL